MNEPIEIEIADCRDIVYGISVCDTTEKHHRSTDKLRRSIMWKYTATQIIWLITFAVVLFRLYG